MGNAYFFGYGSLVNRQTHIYAPCHAARAHGWRRAWRFAADRQVAFLTVIPDPDCSIDGLIAPVPGADWAALDLREAAYDRLPAEVDHPLPADSTDIAIYAIPPDRLNRPDADHPVLLSYIDVVLQGYLAVWGRDGADRFLATTDGWEAPILDDRHQPRYPRAQTLSGADRAYVDAALARLGCRTFA
ncbi:gamma-glutamylcyclotransferase family protein [Thalassococcus sp. BH17M4-6]|uniref:gamma-glutamylcyclotransferase family protein n=1 Tax=Thalassococcus sp. BH17M4-6 TaxID=3413148 RepID=UPI003BF60864